MIGWIGIAGCWTTNLNIADVGVLTSGAGRGRSLIPPGISLSRLIIRLASSRISAFPATSIDFPRIATDDDDNPTRGLTGNAVIPGVLGE